MSLVDVITRLNRPIILICMGGAVIYLAVTGHDAAVQALIGQFVAISSFAYGVHAGAQVPQQVSQTPKAAE